MFYKSTLLWGLLCIGISGALAQQGNPAAGNYDPHAAFNPLFYTYNGNEFRSASGTPGSKYWQNRADYHIVAELDELKHTVSGTVTISYTNNSPDKLPFLWLQLDQNLFSPDSRGNALIASGSRYGSRGEQLKGGYQIEGITVSRKMKPLKFTTLTEDTRMQLRLASPMEPA